MSTPADVNRLVTTVDQYEQMVSMTEATFRVYLEAEAELEGILISESEAAAAEFDFDRCEQLLDQVATLNQTFCDIADRELGRLGVAANQDFAAELRFLREAAEGLILLVSGLRLANRAEERRMASDLNSAERLLNESMEYFAQLSDSDLPQNGIGELRGQLAVASAALIAGLRESRSGQFHGAYQEFDATRVRLDIILSDAEEEYEALDAAIAAQIAAQYEDLCRDLRTMRSGIVALQSLVELLREVQSGNYVEAVECGAEAERLYEEILQAAIQSGTSRYARALHEAELALVRGWHALSRAELAIDREQYSECRDFLREARAQWNEAFRIASRNSVRGIAGQPDLGNTEMLLQSTLRRCNREASFRKRINEMQAENEKLRQTIVIAEGGHVVHGDQINQSGEAAVGKVVYGA